MLTVRVISHATGFQIGELNIFDETDAPQRTDIIFMPKFSREVDAPWKLVEVQMQLHNYDRIEFPLSEKDATAIFQKQLHQTLLRIENLLGEINRGVHTTHVIEKS